MAADLEIYLVRHAESTNNVLQHELHEMKYDAPAINKELIHNLEQQWLAKRSSDPRSTTHCFMRMYYGLYKSQR